jgi:hypothetical protein
MLSAELLEARGGDLMNNHLSVRTFELKQAKVRKCDTCRDWGIQELPLHMVGKRVWNGGD